MDTNGDGLITYQEFASFFSRMSKDGYRSNHDGDGDGDGANDDGNNGGANNGINGDDDTDELGVVWSQLRGIDSEFATDEERSQWLQELRETMTPHVCANTESFANALDQVSMYPLSCLFPRFVSPFPRSLIDPTSPMI